MFHWLQILYRLKNGKSDNGSGSGWGDSVSCGHSGVSGNVYDNSSSSTSVVEVLVVDEEVEFSHKTCETHSTNQY